MSSLPQRAMQLPISSPNKRATLCVLASALERGGDDSVAALAESARLSEAEVEVALDSLEAELWIERTPREDGFVTWSLFDGEGEPL